MIRDVLADAEIEIEKYLEDDTFGQTTEPLQSVIDNLLAHMRAVRMLPGFDRPPVTEEEKTVYFAVIQARWPLK